MNDTAFVGIISLIMLIIIVIIFWYIGFISANAEQYHITGKVIDKWIGLGEHGSHYLLRLENNQMLEVDRNIFYSGPEYNPDIIYSNIKVNITYDFTCVGWQLNWAGFYWYPYVIKAEKVS